MAGRLLARTTIGKTRVNSGAVNVATVKHTVRARLGKWPHDDSVAHVALLDHNMVPDSNDITKWIHEASLHGAKSIRTGALFPGAADAFEAAGFKPIERLSLFEHDLSLSRPRTTTLRAAGSLRRKSPLRRLRFADLDSAAIVDGLAFDSPWNNDASALEEICKATPHYRSRSIAEDGRIVAFAISGRTSSWGYIQRIAVDPDRRRAGLGRALVTDALDWMFRRKVRRAMVNTAADNSAATSLYTSVGFELCREPLVIFELTIDEPLQ
jgi:ribosomal protein S18 acetylase RimI-like enzyme